MAESLVEGEKGKSSLGLCQIYHLEELATDRYLCAQVGVRPWEIVRGGALRGKFCSGTCKFIARDAYVTGYPPYLGCRA